MPTTIEHDTNNSFDWDTIETITDENGVVTSVRTKYDNGTELLSLFSDGPIPRTDHIYDSVRDGPGGEYDFRSKTIQYLESGEVFYDRVRHDDGYAYETAYAANGSVSALRIDDESDFEDWEFWAESYNNDGSLNRQWVEWDNGRYVDTYWQGGILDRQSLSDRSEGGEAFAWSRKALSFDSDGVMRFRKIYFDNGVEKTERWEGGVRTDLSISDKDDARNYQTINVLYDENGELASKVTLFDSGVVRTELWENGIRSETTNADLEDAKSYETQTTSYDANGLIAERTTHYDNGVERIESWAGGTRTETRFDDIDDVHRYTSKIIRYDEDGDVEFRFTQYDDGDEQELDYIDGQLVRKHQFDGSDSADWTTITDEFEGGELVSRTTVFDDGTVEVENFGTEDQFLF